MRYNATDFLNSLFNPADLSPEWLEMWGERAGIREYDGDLPKEQVEAAALADILHLLRERGISLPPRH